MWLIVLRNIFGMSTQTLVIECHSCTNQEDSFFSFIIFVALISCTLIFNRVMGTSKSNGGGVYIDNCDIFLNDEDIICKQGEVSLMFV